MSRVDRFKTALKVIAVLAAVAVLLVIGHALRLEERLREVIAWIGGLGAWGPILFVVLYVLAAVLFVPGTIPTLSAGLLFGIILGSIYVSIGSVLGATCAFLVGRHLARGWVSRRIEGNPRFRAIDEAVAHEGWKIVLLTRLSPVFPFNLLNYAYGLTRVSLRHFVLASWIGMLPGTVLYVYIGSLFRSVAEIQTADRARTPLEWAFYAAGLVVTIGVTLYVTRLARRALKERVSEETPP
jgi:uncharacterized membrane protein YdjX (TVP38/TMEM64 family)